jgi:hypothetical protein
LRFGKRVKGVSPLGSIRKRCYDCSGFNWAEVRNCPNEFQGFEPDEIETCPLWRYRMGRRPPREQGGNAKNPLPTTRFDDAETRTGVETPSEAGEIGQVDV